MALAGRVEEKKLGKDEFLKILITQLQNQDPMQPMQDRDFIAQMAQFSSVEQLMNISTQMNTMQQTLGMSSNMIGKEITWIAQKDAASTDGKESTTQIKTGIVDSILVRDNQMYAKVGKDEVEMKYISEIRMPSSGQVDGNATSKPEQAVDGNS
ncbi:flagellar hook capping protein [Paenibacillus popilliae]|nr:flagellar hook capping protein [Paenibacillus sp. SDF0028]